MILANKRKFVYCALEFFCWTIGVRFAHGLERVIDFFGPVNYSVYVNFMYKSLEGIKDETR